MFVVDRVSRTVWRRRARGSRAWHHLDSALIAGCRNTRGTL